MCNDFFNREIEPGVIILYPKRKDRGFCIGLCLEINNDIVKVLKLKRDNTFRKVNIKNIKSIAVIP